MKGNISLVDFISQVKGELKQAQVDPSEGFFQLEEATLEVSFALEAEGGGKFRFLVFDASAKGTAKQLHKVTLKFKPLSDSEEASTEVKQTGLSTRPRAARVPKDKIRPRKVYAAKKA